MVRSGLLRQPCVSRSPSQPGGSVEQRHPRTTHNHAHRQLFGLHGACTPCYMLQSLEAHTHQDGEFSVEGWLDCAAPPTRVYDCLTDYAGLADTFSNISGTEVLREDGRLKVRQTCSWQFLVFSGTFDLLLRVNEEPERMALTFDLVESAFMHSFLGVWTVRTCVYALLCVIVDCSPLQPVCSSSPCYTTLHCVHTHR